MSQQVSEQSPNIKGKSRLLNIENIDKPGQARIDSYNIIT